MSLSARAVQELERLFDQQMWAFGRDVVRPAGNLLALRGCRKTPSESPGATSSVWRLSEPGLELELSSRGVRAVVDGRACFLDREPMPKLLREADVVPLPGLFAWFARYEAWVEEQCPGWREESLGQRSRRPSFPAQVMSARWAAFAEAVEASRPWPAGGPSMPVVEGPPDTLRHASV